MNRSTFVAVVASCLLAVVLMLTSGLPMEIAAVSAQTFNYLPIVMAPVPVVPVPTSSVYVENDTGGKLCYQIMGTGIGEQCYGSGEHFYGTFPAGTYEFCAEARCGKLCDDRYYGEGIATHRFYCGYATLHLE